MRIAVDLMNSVYLAGREIGPNAAPYIIAEIGAMQENIAGMKELIKVAKDAGADSVKIQTYQAKNLALPNAIFQFEDGSTLSQFDYFNQYEISRDDHCVLFDYAKEVGIPLFSSPSHNNDVDFLEKIGITAYKIGSDDLTNYPLLEYIASKNKPILVSTGMATLAEVEKAIETVNSAGNSQIILLHCTVSYPPDPNFANLNIITTLKNAFDLPIGYSDHVFGVFSSVLAASMGACVIEKHLTLDRRLKRPDYEVSLQPKEFNEMVEQIRLVGVLQGSSVKKVYETEEKWRKNARKSLVAVRDMDEGEIINKDDIKIMRPGTGIHPQYIDMVEGRRLRKPIKANDIIPKDAI